ncbi:MAG: hypothetical protein ACI86X_001321 [Moritella sp.]|jgi:hypothetical protein
MWSLYDSMVKYFKKISHIDITDILNTNKKRQLKSQALKEKLDFAFTQRQDSSNEG